MRKRFSGWTSAFALQVAASLVFAVMGWAQSPEFVQSDVIGSEDIWENPSFAGGSANNGATAHSEI